MNFKMDVSISGKKKKKSLKVVAILVGIALNL